MIKKYLKYIFLGVFILGLILAPNQMTQAEDHQLLRYAIVGEPPSLDQHVITSDLATTLAQHSFEGLFTFNESYEPVPMLAESYELKEDGRLVEISLREGVLFHDGSEMTAEDVVASLERWGEYGVRGPVLFGYVDGVNEIDDYTISIEFREPFGPWMHLLAYINGGPTIHPKEIMQNAGAEPISTNDYIGTGPYKFEQWVAGRNITFVKFDDYVAKEEEADGYAGKKVAYIDELEFVPVEDESTRVYGIEAGDYHYAEQIPADLYDSLNDNPEINVYVQDAPSHPLIFMNLREGILANNQDLRQALVMALDFPPALMTAYGPEELWDASGSIFPPQTEWYSENGTELYNEVDLDKIEELINRSGYDGEEIRLAVSREYMHHYDQSVIFAQQWQEVGLNVELDVYDWATLVDIRGQEEQWDMFFTHHGFVPEPSLHTRMSTAYPGWWDTDEFNDLYSRLVETTVMEERYEIWDEFQGLIYDQVPIIKTGDFYNYNIASPEVEGLYEFAPLWPFFWNAQL